MPYQTPLILCFSAILLINLSGCSGSGEDQRSWEPIFNGVDLTGWSPKIVGHPLGENWRNTFMVEDRVLKVSYAEYDSFRLEFGHLFYQDTFTHYRLRLEYRFVGPPFPGTPDWALRNSGLMAHGQPAESMGLDQGFPVSLEAQFLGGMVDSVARPTGNLCTPGMHVDIDGSQVTEHCTPSSSPTFYHDDWVRFEFIAAPNGMFYHVVEGDTVIRYSRPVIGGEYLPEGYLRPEGSPVTGGTISLQSEGHPIEFRRLEVMRLDGTGLAK